MTKIRNPLRAILKIVASAIAWVWRTSCWAVIALGFIPFPPLQWWALHTAVSHGRTRAVKILARPSLFARMPPSVNAKIMLKAGHCASEPHSTAANKQIFEWLLGHGGIISQQSLNEDGGFACFCLQDFACQKDWVKQAISHNAIADDTKYELFVYCLEDEYYSARSNIQNTNVCATMLSTWKDFFNTLQDDKEIYWILWAKVLDYGSQQTLHTLITHSSYKHVQFQIKNIVLGPKCSVETLHALSIHVDVEKAVRNLHALHRTPSGHVSSSPFEKWLSYYPHLSEVYTAHCNQQQNQLLKTHIEEYHPAPSQRKM